MVLTHSLDHIKDTFSYGKRGGPLHFDALDRSLCCSSNLVDGAGAAMYSMSAVSAHNQIHTYIDIHTLIFFPSNKGILINFNYSSDLLDGVEARYSCPSKISPKKQNGYVCK